jgi:hypothetical protein
MYLFVETTFHQIFTRFSDLQEHAFALYHALNVPVSLRWNFDMMCYLLDSVEFV